MLVLKYIFLNLKNMQVNKNFCYIDFAHINLIYFMGNDGHCLRNLYKGEWDVRFAYYTQGK